MPLPVEILFQGIPISLQAKSASKRRWSARFRRQIDGQFDIKDLPTDKMVSLKITLIQEIQLQGDLDNIIKPIQDALEGIVYLDDAQVQNVEVTRIVKERNPQIKEPGINLVKALEEDDPSTLIEVREYNG